MNRLLGWIPLLVWAPLAACEGESRTAEDVAGEYAFTTVDGEPLPAIVMQASPDGEQCAVELVRGRYTLRADESFRAVVDFRDACARATTTHLTLRGRFELRGPRGDSILYRVADQPVPDRGLLQGKNMTLRIVEDGDVSLTTLKRID